MGTTQGTGTVAPVSRVASLRVQWWVVPLSRGTSSCPNAFTASVLGPAGLAAWLLGPCTLLSFRALTPLLLHLSFLFGGPLSIHEAWVSDRLLEAARAVVP